MAKCAIYKNGFSLSPMLSPRGVKVGGGKRGKLEGKCSSASFRRLREWCITHDCLGDCWGITLTVPGLDLVTVDEFKVLHHKLCVFSNYHHIPMIWRVELQQRKMPHLHIVSYGSVENQVLVMLHWFKLLDDLKVWNIERVGDKSKDVCFISRAFCAGSVHAVELQKLDGDFRAFRYLVSHMSKQKLAQLGWAGRSWGVVNRSAFTDCSPDVKHLCLSDYYSVVRWLRRLTRFHGVVTVQRRRFGKVVKRHYSRRIERKVRSCAFWVTDPAIIRRMIQYVLLHSEKVPF